MLNAIAAILASLALFFSVHAAIPAAKAKPVAAPACQLVAITIVGDERLQTQPNWHSLLLVNPSSLPSNTEFHSTFETMAVGLNAGASMRVPFRTGGVVTITGTRAGTQIYACHQKAP